MTAGTDDIGCAGIPCICLKVTMDAVNRRGEPTTLQRSSSTQISGQRLLRLRQVSDLTGLGRSCIYRMQAEKRFPQSIKIGVRAVRWLETEVTSWIGARIQLSREIREEKH